MARSRCAHIHHSSGGPRQSDPLLSETSPDAEPTSQLSPSVIEPSSHDLGPPTPQTARPSLAGAATPVPPAIDLIGGPDDGGTRTPVATTTLPTMTTTKAVHDIDAEEDIYDQHMREGWDLLPQPGLPSHGGPCHIDWGPDVAPARARDAAGPQSERHSMPPASATAAPPTDIGERHHRYLGSDQGGGATPDGDGGTDDPLGARHSDPLADAQTEPPQRPSPSSRMV